MGGGSLARGRSVGASRKLLGRGDPGAHRRSAHPVAVMVAAHPEPLAQPRARRSQTHVSLLDELHAGCARRPHRRNRHSRHTRTTSHIDRACAFVPRGTRTTSRAQIAVASGGDGRIPKIWHERRVAEGPGSRFSRCRLRVRRRMTSIPSRRTSPRARAPRAAAVLTRRFPRPRQAAWVPAVTPRRAVGTTRPARRKARAVPLLPEALEVLQEPPVAALRAAKLRWGSSQSTTSTSPKIA